MDRPLKVIAGAPDKPLRIGDIEIPCYVLEDETRVLSQSGFYDGLGMARRGNVRAAGGAHLPRFAASKALSSYIEGEIKAGLINPISFEIEGAPAYGYGYPALLFVDFCRAVLGARRDGALNYQQLPMAERCELILDGLATVGIIALVDETTGYQEFRSRRALTDIMEQFLAEERQQWAKTFSDDYYRQLYRLKGWGEPDGTNHPSVVGHITNDIVYNRVAPGLLRELQSRNPSVDGRREVRHHQWFTPDYGYPRLKEHLAGLLALMRSATSWDDFIERLEFAYPRRFIGDAPDLFDDE